MRRQIVGVILLAAVAVAAVSARQGQSVPGLGTGVVTVNGVVGIANTVPVTQSGAWKVGLDGTADVRVSNEPVVWIAPPSFIKPRGRYSITWNDGATDNLTVFDQTGNPIPSAGLITSTQTHAREIQFALKVIW